MQPRTLTPVLVALALLAGAAPAQTVSPGLTKVATYTSANLGVQQGAGGIEFGTTGKTLYINDWRQGKVIALTVVRNASNQITGFSKPTTVLTSKATGKLDGGLSFSGIGTMIVTNYSPADLEQYSAATKAHTLIRLSTTGLVGNTGGGDFIPAMGGRKERYLVSDYDNGGIYEIPLTLQANLTYTLGKAKIFLRTPKGIDGFELVPTGPFGNGRGIVVVNYDNSRIDFAALDPKTNNPFTRANGTSLLVPLITGMSEPMDIEFDPITKDMFVTDYSSGTATMMQFRGEIRGGLDGSFDLFGPGCPQKSGAVPTLDTANAKMRGGFPISIRLSAMPVSSTSMVLLGLGNNGNLGGFLFPGTACRAHCNPLLMVPLAINASGVGTISGTVPVALRGLTLFTQGWAVSKGANPLDLTVSDAAVCIVGR